MEAGPVNDHQNGADLGCQRDPYEELQAFTAGPERRLGVVPFERDRGTVRLTAVEEAKTAEQLSRAAMLVAVKAKPR